MKIAYPTIFTELETNILIEVPDLGIWTEANEEGKNKAGLAEAVSMARDAIGLKCIFLEEQGIDLIPPSRIQDIDMTKSTFYEKGKTFVSIVDAELEIFCKRNERAL